MYLSAEPPERKPRAQLTEKAPNPPSFCRKKVPFFVLGRRWPPGKFSPHAGAATHGNGISKLATHPPQHADAPSLQLAAVVLSPFPSHRRGHESAAAFSRSAPRRGAPRRAVCRPAAPAGKISTARRCFNPRKWHFRTRHPPATPRGCALPLQLAVKPGVSQPEHCRFCDNLALSANHAALQCAPSSLS